MYGTWITLTRSTLQATVHFYGKNLLGNNSPWDFDLIVDATNPYWFLPDKNFISQSSGTRFFCTSKIGAINDKKFISPTWCIKEKFCLLNLGVAEVFLLESGVQFSFGALFWIVVSNYCSAIWIRNFQDKNIYLGRFSWGL